MKNGQSISEQSVCVGSHWPCASNLSRCCFSVFLHLHLAALCNAEFSSVRSVPSDTFGLWHCALLCCVNVGVCICTGISLQLSV